jgi:hypothetical protein
VYWRWDHIPELADLPPRERRRLWNEATRDRFRVCDLVLLPVIVGICLAAGVAWSSVPRDLSVWIRLPIFLTGFFGFRALVHALLIPRYRPVIRHLRGGG